MNKIEISTKEKIINVSINLFSEKGYTDTSLREIAKNTGIKASSIYNHFKSKDEILQEILDIYEKKIITSTPVGREKELDTNSLTAKKLCKYMFFKFPSKDVNKYLKIIKIIHSEYLRNKNVKRFFKDRIIIADYEYIKGILDYLVDKEIIKCNTALATTMLSSIILSYTVYSNLGMQFTEFGDEGSNMFEVLIFVLQKILEGQIC